MNITDTLNDREKKYGSFAANAHIAQGLKAVARSSNGWHSLPDTQREAIEMIFHNIARQINAAEDYPDNFHDIAGYATLAEQEILSQLREKSEGEADIFANLK